MPATSTQSGPHLARVDALRGWAILLVFFHHYWIPVRTMTNERFGAGWERLALVPWEFGFLGVKLFFVISGFCIHLSFLNWARNRPAGAPFWKPFLASFFWRRFWRIYPPYLGALLVLYLIQYAEPLAARSLRHLAVHGLMVHNLSPAFIWNINPAFWSIAVEWQLYVVYPLFLWMVRTWRIEVACAVASGAALACQFVAPHFTDSFLILRSPFAYWLEWVIGALIAEFFVSGRSVFRRHGWLFPGSGLLLAYALVFSGSQPVLCLLQTLFFAVWLEWCLRRSDAVSRAERWLVPVGLCSYSLYLWHGPYLAWCTGRLSRWLADAPAVAVWGLVPLALLLPIFAGCWMYYRWVELGSIAAGRRRRV